MDLDKSIYMKEFYDMRTNIGTMSYESVESPLMKNIYGDLRPKKEITKIKEVINTIEEKTILVVKNNDKMKPKQDKANKEEKGDKADKSEKGDKAEKGDKEEKADKPKSMDDMKPPKKGGDEPSSDKELSSDKESSEEPSSKTGGETLFSDAIDSEPSVGGEIDDEDPLLEGGSMIKTITFNPNYVVGE